MTNPPIGVANLKRGSSSCRYDHLESVKEPLNEWSQPSSITNKPHDVQGRSSTKLGLSPQGYQSGSQALETRCIEAESNNLKGHPDQPDQKLDRTATTEETPVDTRVPICEPFTDCPLCAASEERMKTDYQQYGIGVPKGEVAKTPEEAEAIAKRLGMTETIVKQKDTDLTRRR